jgi:ABC-type multidrug transport system fused ATPase/permease subunit
MPLVALDLPLPLPFYIHLPGDEQGRNGPGLTFVESAIWNSMNIITGVILLLVAQSLSSVNGKPAMSLGDFSLFIYYLGFTTQFTAMTGVVWAMFKQAGVSVARLCSEALRDNILMGIPEEHADIPAAIHLSVIDKDIADFEHGLDTIIGSKGVKISGGQRQRTAAARMFVRQPELLVVDDLSSALDVETERTLWEQVAGGTGLKVSNSRTS